MGENCPATSSTSRSPPKRKSVIRPTGKALDLSPLTSSPTFSFAADIDQDSTSSLSIGANLDRELELVVSCIILEPKEEEEAMTSNLRAGFKERQRKCLFESLPTTPPPAKRTCTEGPHEVLVPDTLLAPMSPSDAAGSS